MSRKSNKNRRVVVTGLGVVSSIGIGWQEFWKNLIAGKSGISKVTAFDTSKYDRHYGGEVKNFDPSKFMSEKKADQIGRASQLTIAASKLALKDAKMSIKSLSRNKAGVYTGTTMGETQVLQNVTDINFKKGGYISAFFHALRYPSNTISAAVSNHFLLHENTGTFSNACASGNCAIGRSFDLIKSGNVDIMLAGGADAFSRIAFTGFSRLLNMAHETCRPFDKNRDGMILGEGSGVVLLESLENARKRNAKIYAEILGYGLSCNANNMTIPSTKGIAMAIRKSLNTSKVNVDTVDYISAHGTATKENDGAECDAMKSVFGRHIKKIPISSIKSMLGHPMGAAAALEAIACCLTIKHNIIPPTINFEEKDPECDIDCVPNVSRKHDVRIAVNNSCAFGGNNACVVIAEVREDQL